MPQPRKIPIEKLTALITKATQGNQGLMLTDRQLLHAMNRGMKRCERICYRTFQRYKTLAIAYGEAELDCQDKFDPTYADLYDAFMDNEIAQKLALYEKMLAADAQQSRNYKWIMERKFPDLNPRLLAQKEMAQYDLIEKSNQAEDLKDYKNELEIAREQQRYAKYQQRHPAPLVEHATQETESHIEKQQPTPIATQKPATTNLSELWIKPNGTRRTKEEFIKAVKRQKALM